jgi:peptidoglycan hydrolase CwlO-like protein
MQSAIVSYQNNIIKQNYSTHYQNKNQHVFNAQTTETLNLLQKHLLKLGARLNKHKAKQKVNEAKAEQSHNFMLAEIKHANDTTQESVIAAIEKLTLM